ncbi:MAG: cytochrome c nitrite reductase small subunit [Desulfobacteraceae bacterium]|nr:cytochrome c nitrite reductase small subunit [Desulfobacteraceae bacterium]
MKVYLISGLAATSAVILFFLFGPPRLLAKSSESAFCARCHVMEAEYYAWIHGGAHSGKKCVDCHLPNQNEAVFYVWKSIDGLKDMLVFYSGRVPERIKASDHAKDVLQANCIRCHTQTVCNIYKKRRCWGCHRRISHRSAGMRETL